MKKEIEDTKTEIMHLQKETEPIIAETNIRKGKCAEMNHTITGTKKSIDEHKRKKPEH